MRAMRKQLQASGIPVENSKGEWGPGQEEINVRYADALTMADRHVVMKNAIKEIAHAQGKAITFMAKWDYGLAGSSSHIHMSLAKARQERRSSTQGRPLGMSPMMQQLRAGLLSLRRATSPISSRPTSTPTSASRPAPSRPPRRSGAATTAPPASASAARTPRASASSAASAAPTSTPISPSPPCSPPASTGIEEKLDAGAGLLRRRLCSARSSAKSPRPCATPPRRCANRRCCARRSASGVDRPLRPHRRVGAVRIRPPHHRLGVEARVRADVDDAAAFDRSDR